MATQSVQVYYGDSPSGLPDGSLFIDSATGVAYVIQNGRSVAVGHGVRDTAGAGGAPPLLLSGTGVPGMAAPQGSLYTRKDGSSTSTRVYVNTNGSTGWAAVTTAS